MQEVEGENYGNFKYPINHMKHIARPYQNVYLFPQHWKAYEEEDKIRHSSREQNLIVENRKVEMENGGGEWELGNWK